MSFGGNIWRDNKASSFEYFYEYISERLTFSQEDGVCVCVSH